MTVSEPIFSCAGQLLLKTPVPSFIKIIQTLWSLILRQTQMERYVHTARSSLLRKQRLIYVTLWLKFYVLT